MVALVLAGRVEMRCIRMLRLGATSKLTVFTSIEKGYFGGSSLPSPQILAQCWPWCTFVLGIALTSSFAPAAGSDLLLRVLATNLTMTSSSAPAMAKLATTPSRLTPTASLSCLLQVTIVCATALLDFDVVYMCVVLTSVTHLDYVLSLLCAVNCVCQYSQCAIHCMSQCW
jgi:hypothetical protein